MKHKDPKDLRPLLASTGRMRNTMSASKPLALRNGSFCALNIALKRLTPGSRPSARDSMDNPSLCAWN